MKKTVLTSLLMLSSLALAEPVEVTLWVSHGNEELNAIKQIAENFNKKSKDIQVKVVQVAGSETDTAKLTTAIAGGTGPDIYMLDRFIVSERAGSGFLQPLDPYIKTQSPNIAKDYLPFAWEETQFKGQTYALPFDTDTRVLYYRKDILKEVGVDPEVLDPKNGVPSIKLIVDIANKVNKTDDKGNYTRLGMVPWDNQGWHYTWGYAFGGDFYDEKNCKVTPTNKNVVAGFQFLYDYAKNLDPKKVQTFLSTYSGSVKGPFITGRLAFSISGDWDIAGMKKNAPDVDYGITYIPTPNGKKVSWAGGWSLVMPRGAKNPEEAFTFMRYMAGADGQRTYIKATSHLPTVKKLLNEKGLFDSKHTFFKNLLPYAKSRPALPVGALYWDQLTSAQGKVILNQMEPLAALKQVEDRVNNQLRRFCK